MISSMSLIASKTVLILKIIVRKQIEMIKLPDVVVALSIRSFRLLATQIMCITCKKVVKPIERMTKVIFVLNRCFRIDWAESMPKMAKLLRTDSKTFILENFCIDLKRSKKTVLLRVCLFLTVFTRPSELNICDLLNLKVPLNRLCLKYQT